MNNMRNKILMTLALLLTAVTGAWAGEEPQLLTTINASSSFLTGSQTFDDIATVTFGGAGTIPPSPLVELAQSHLMIKMDGFRTNMRKSQR